jgi:hypothetical protein
MISQNIIHVEYECIWWTDLSRTCCVCPVTVSTDMANRGLMAENMFLGQAQLLQWLNNSLSLKLEKIEEVWSMGGGCGLSQRRSVCCWLLRLLGEWPVLASFITPIVCYDIKYSTITDMNTVLL